MKYFIRLNFFINKNVLWIMILFLQFNRFIFFLNRFFLNLNIFLTIIFLSHNCLICRLINFIIVALCIILILHAIFNIFFVGLIMILMLSSQWIIWILFSWFGLINTQNWLLRNKNLVLYLLYILSLLIFIIVTIWILLFYAFWLLDYYLLYLRNALVFIFTFVIWNQYWFLNLF